MYKIFKIAIFFLVLLVGWEILHEYFHFSVCILSGYTGRVDFPLMSSYSTDCPGIKNADSNVRLLYSGLPYIIDFSIIVLFNIFLIKNIFRLLPYVVTIDYITNYINSITMKTDFYNINAIAASWLCIFSSMFVLTVLGMILYFYRRDLRTIINNFRNSSTSAPLRARPPRPEAPRPRPAA